MANTSAKLKRLAEVEMLRLQIEGRRAARNVFIISVAVIVGAISLCFFTYGTYLFLATRIGEINSAFTIGGALLTIASLAFVLAVKRPGQLEVRESETLKRTIADARDDLRDDLDALEARFDKVSGGLAKILDSRKEDESRGHINLATITLLLSAIGAASPTLNRYIQPILKILS